MDVRRDRTAVQRRRWLRWTMVLVCAATVGFAFRPLAGAALSLVGEAGARWLLPSAQELSAPSPAGEATIAAAPSAAESVTAPQGSGAEGVTIPPEYAEWVLVGTATGLSYSEGTGNAEDHGAPGAFTQVFLEPSAYRSYLDRGEFPEGTTFVLEIRRPTSGVSIARGGWFAGRLQGVHAAVKSEAYEGGWAYFDVAADGAARQLATRSCASCHAQHAAVDNVFVQFYPRLQFRDRRGPD